MSGIGLDKLREYARSGDVELRVTRTDDPDQPKIESREGSLGGRLMRQLKIDFGEDRRQKQVEYGEAHTEVFEALRRIYGEEIGEKAFRAGGFGREGQDGDWLTNTNQPITGRHIKKMLEYGDREYAREVARNSKIGGWIGALRHDGRGAPDVTLGEKISQPRGSIRKEQAFRHLGGDLTDAIDDWHRNGVDRHGFWVLDLGLEGGTGRIGIHVDRSNPDRLQLLGLDGDYNVNIPKGDFPKWLGDHLQGRPVTSLGLYRAQEDTTRTLFERMDDLKQTLDGLTSWTGFMGTGKGGVRNWLPEALDAIRDSSQLLRSNVSMQGNTQALKQQIDLQLAQINRYLNETESARPMQTYLDERQAFVGGLTGKVAPYLDSIGIGDRDTQTRIHRALIKEAESFMGELRARRGSLSDEQTREELSERLGSKLNELLEDLDWSFEDRHDAMEKAEQVFGPWLTQLNDEVFTPLQQRLDALEPLRLDVAQELEKQRTLLEAKSKDLQIGVQVEYNDDTHLGTEGILKPEGARGSGFGARVTDRVEVLPMQLQFDRQVTKDGTTIVATVPNLFSGVNPETGRAGRYDTSYRTTERSLSWDGFVESHHDRLSRDKSGVPGNKELHLSPIVPNLGHVGLKVGDNDPERVSFESVIDLSSLKAPNGEYLLNPQQVCGLSRFLNDEAFQQAYAQALRRLLPPPEDGVPRETRCRDVMVLVDVSTGDDGQPVIDISFRGELPDDLSLRYQALPHDGVLPQDAPVLEAEGDDLVLSLTMHVPLDQLRSGQPQVTFDEPVIRFVFAPEEDQLHLPPQEL